MATGKYNPLGLKMIDSARKYFLPSCDRTFFIFTDGDTPTTNDIVRASNKSAWDGLMILSEPFSCLFQASKSA